MTADHSIPHVAMIVGNDVTADTRVKKMAATLARAGLRVTVLGVSRTGRRTEGWMGDVRVVRLPVTFALRDHQRAARPSRRPSLAYRTKQEYIAGRRRFKVRDREAVSAISRAVTRLRATQDAPRPSGELSGLLLREEIRLRRLVLTARRHEARLRQGLYRRRAAGGGPDWRLRPGTVQRLAALPVFSGWRRVLPYLDDFELSFGPELDELAPDVIHAHDVHMVGIADRAVARARGQGRRVAWVYDAHEHVAGLPTKNARVLSALVALEREYVRGADRVVTVSEPIADLLHEHYRLSRRPSVVLNIPVGAPPSADPPSVRRAAGLPDGVPLVVYSGGVSQARGLTTVVEAVAALPGVHLALVVKATSAHVAELEALAERAACRDRVHLVPFVAPDEVSSYLSSADVGVIALTHVGNHEVALPNKFFEYLHAGLPIVTSDVRALAALVGELGVGEVFTAGDAASLAGALRRVLDDRPRYVAPLRERPEILERYSWEHEAEILEALYRDLVGDLRPGGERSPITLAELGDPPATGTEVRLAIGPSNTAGQAWAWAEALRRHQPGTAVEVFAVAKQSRLVFPADTVIPADSWRSLDWQLGQVRHLLRTTTHLLVEAGSSVFGTLNGDTFGGDLPALQAHGVQVALVFHGSEIRDPRVHRQLEPSSPFADEQAELFLRQLVRAERLSAELARVGLPRYVTTMDLLDHVPDAIWLPVVVDVDVDQPPGPPPLLRARPVVVHAPSSGAVKGSAAVDVIAEELAARGVIEYRRLRDVPPAEVPAALAGADVVLDQFAIGDYGVLACQAMAKGRVVVGHVADRVRKRLPAELPVVQATAADLREVLLRVVEERDAARATAAQGVDYVRAYHDGRHAVTQLRPFLAGEES